MSSWFSNIQLQQPAWLWLLALLPVFLLLRGAAGRRAALQYSSLQLLRDVARPARSAAGFFTWSGMFLTFLCGVLALSRPQRLHTDERVEESGVEIFICLDLSLSMSIEDMVVINERGREKVNRLTVAKKVIRDFISGRTSDRVGMVVFAGRPYIASPLTLDRGWILGVLEQIYFNQTGDMGTAIGSAISTAATKLGERALSEKERKSLAGRGMTVDELAKREVKTSSRIIILLTDGANNSGKVGPRQAAELSKKFGIKIYTVAIGTEGHHLVPVPTPDGQRVGVRQEFDEETLKAVAEMTDGRFYQARDGQALEKIFREIDQLEKIKLNVLKETRVEELFHWPLWTALGFGFLSILLHQLFTRRYP